MLHWDPLRSLFSAEPRLRVCVHVCGVFFKEILPLDYVCRYSQGSIKGTVPSTELIVQNVPKRQQAGAIDLLRSGWHLQERSLCGRYQLDCQKGPKLQIWEWETVLRGGGVVASTAHQQRALNTLSARTQRPLSKVDAGRQGSLLARLRPVSASP